MPDSGVELIAAERQRQIEVEGWTPDHDAEHGDFDLVKAAHSYVLASLEPKYWGLASGNVPVWWPWDEEWWKPSDDEIRNLVQGRGADRRGDRQVADHLMTAEVWPSVTTIREDPRTIDVKRLRWNLYTWHIEAVSKVWLGLGSRADLEDAYLDFQRTLRSPRCLP